MTDDERTDPGTALALGVEPSAFRAVMAQFAAGVTVITTVDEAGTPYGLTATAFASLSLDPPLCLACVDRETEAHPVIGRARRFAVNILSARQAAIATRFAQSGTDKFAGSSWAPGDATGCPLLPDVIAWAECLLEATHPGGDHEVFVGRIVAMHVRGGDPLLFHAGDYGHLTRAGAR